MALAATVVGEVRWGGNILNGALFNPARVGAGTDRTQQTAPHYNVANLAVDAGVNTRVTTATHNAVDADIANHWHIQGGGGWTGGMYEVVSRTGTAFNLDRSPAATGTTGGAARLGGALGLPGEIAAFQPEGSIWWVQHPGGSNIYNAGINLTGAATSLNFCKVIGYGSTRGDGVRVPVQRISGTDTWVVGGNFMAIANFSVYNGNSSGAIHGFNVVGSGCIFENIESYGGGNPLENAGFRNTFRRCLFRDPEVAASPCAALGSSGGNPNQGGLFEFCTFQGGLAQGVLIGDGGFYLFNNCLMVENTTHGIEGSSRYGFHLRNCTIARNILDGWRHSSSDVNALLHNVSIQRCLFGRNGGYDIRATGVDFSAQTEWAKWALRHNAFYSTGLGRLSQWPTGQDDVILTADPWTDAPNSDYTINNVANGGAYLRNNPPTVSFLPF